MNGFRESASRFLLHFFLGVLINFCFVALFTGLIGCAEHSAFLGGQDVDSVTLDRTPPAAISEFRRAHPDGRIIPFDTFNMFYRDEREKKLAELKELYEPRALVGEKLVQVGVR